VPSSGHTVRLERKTFSGRWEMNTTALILNWSMSGAGPDLARRFRSGIDVHDATTAQVHEDQPRPEGRGFLVKQADSEDWTLLSTS
jgi:hypothetical protein